MAAPHLPHSSTSSPPRPSQPRSHKEPFFIFAGRSSPAAGARAAWQGSHKHVVPATLGKTTAKHGEKHFSHQQNTQTCSLPLQDPSSQPPSHPRWGTGHQSRSPLGKLMGAETASVSEQESQKITREKKPQQHPMGLPGWPVPPGSAVAPQSQRHGHIPQLEWNSSSPATVARGTRQEPQRENTAQRELQPVALAVLGCSGQG